MSIVTQDTVLPKPVIFNKTVTADREDTSGYAEIYTDTPLNGFYGAGLCGLAASDTYCLRITIDGTPYVVDDIVITSLMDWTAIAAEIQTKLRAATGSTETVAINAGKILITSATTGATSAVLIQEGLTHIPLIAAVEALAAYSTVAIDAATAGVDAIAGEAHLSCAETFVAASVNGLSTDFAIDVTPDGGGLQQVDFSVVAGDDIDDMCVAIQAALQALTLGAETVAVVGNNIRFTSGTTGAASTMLVAEGTGTYEPLVAALEATANYSTVTINAAVPGVAATSGYAVINGCSGATEFVGATVPGFAAGPANYEIDVTIDSTLYAGVVVSLVAADDWDSVAAKLQAAIRALTLSTETCVVATREIVVTSATTGAASNVTLATTTGGGTDLLATIVALGGDYATCVFDNTGSTGADATAGYQEISCAENFVGTDILTIGNIYDLDVTVDGVLQQLSMSVPVNATWTDVAALLQTTLRTATGDVETVVIDTDEVLITSVNPGVASKIHIAEGTAGTGQPMIAALEALAAYTTVVESGVVAGADATAGSQTISCTETFVGATVAALSSEYTINVKVNGGTTYPVAVTLAGTETWTQLAAALQLALRTLTASTEVVNLTNYRIRFTSATNGPLSAMLLTDGSMGRPLVAAITALPNYTGNLGTPVAGREGVVYFQVASEAPTTKDFFMIGMTIDSSNKEKMGAATGLLLSYSKVTGIVSVLDDADAVEVKNGDVITIMGAFA